MISDTDRERLLQIAHAEGLNFEKLVSLAGLDPATSFKGADLRGVDFEDSDLSGFDFEGADLTGACFRSAAIMGLRHEGAIVVDVRWPEEIQVGRPRRLVLGRQEKGAVSAMMADLRTRRRAIGVMPSGTASLRVLEEVLARTFNDTGGRVLFVPSSAVERKTVISRLLQRFPNVPVGSLKELRARAASRGILVHNQIGIGGSLAAQLEGTPWAEHVDAVFATSTERLTKVLDSLPATTASLLVALDPALLDIGRREFAQQWARIRRIFERPSFEIKFEQGIQAGTLVPVRLITPFPGQSDLLPRRSFPFGNRTRSQEAQMSRLPAVAHGLVELRGTVPFRSALVLCGDDQQARIAREYLASIWSASGEVHSVGQRWAAHDIVDSLDNRDGLLVAPVTRQAVDAAGQADCVVTLTDLKLEHAQDIAFRGKQQRSDTAPLVFDLAGAFRGFPNLEFGLDEFETKEWLHP